MVRAAATSAASTSAASAYMIGRSATRRDPVAAQRENVRTLTDLSALTENFPAPVRQGVAERMASARYNLGCALNKSGRRFGAVWAVLPNLITQPGWRSVRAVVSVLSRMPTTRTIKLGQESWAK